MQFRRIGLVGAVTLAAGLAAAGIAAWGPGHASHHNTADQRAPAGASSPATTAPSPATPIVARTSAPSAQPSQTTAASAGAGSAAPSPTTPPQGLPVSITQSVDVGACTTLQVSGEPRSGDITVSLDGTVSWPSGATTLAITIDGTVTTNDLGDSSISTPQSTEFQASQDVSGTLQNFQVCAASPDVTGTLNITATGYLVQ